MIREIKEKKLLQRVNSYIRDNTRTVGLFGGMGVLILIGVLTFTLSQQKQDLRQRASTPENKGSIISAQARSDP